MSINEVVFQITIAMLALTPIIFVFYQATIAMRELMQYEGKNNCK